jgi:hypothetical protein
VKVEINSPFLSFILLNSSSKSSLETLPILGYRAVPRGPDKYSSKVINNSSKLKRGTLRFGIKWAASIIRRMQAGKNMGMLRTILERAVSITAF